MLLYFILITLFSLFSFSILLKMFTLYAKRYVQKKFERYLLRSQKVILIRKMMKMQAWMTINNNADVFMMLQQEATALYKQDNRFCLTMKSHLSSHQTPSFLTLWKIYKTHQPLAELFVAYEQKVNKWFGIYQQFEDHLMMLCKTRLSNQMIHKNLFFII